MTKMKALNRILEEAKTALPDQTKRIDNHALVFGFVSLCLARANRNDLIEVLKLLVERDVIDLDAVNHTFVVP